MSVSDDMGIRPLGSESPRVEHRENRQTEPTTTDRVAELEKCFEPSSSAGSSISEPFATKDIQLKGKEKGKKPSKIQRPQSSFLQSVISTIREHICVDVKTKAIIPCAPTHRSIKPQLSSSSASSSQSTGRVRYEQPKDEIYKMLGEYHKTKDPILYLVVENGVTTLCCTNKADLEKSEMAEEKKIQNQPSKTGTVTHTQVLRKKSLFRDEKTQTTTRQYNFDPAQVATYLLDSRHGYFSYTEKICLQPLAKEIQEKGQLSSVEIQFLNVCSMPSDQSEIYTNPGMVTVVEGIDRTIPKIGGGTETLSLQRFISEQPAPEVKHDISLKPSVVTDTLHSTLKHYYTLKQRGKNPVLFWQQQEGKKPTLAVQLQGQIHRNKELAQIQTEIVGSTEHHGKSIVYNFNSFDVANFIIHSRSENLSLTERVMLKDLAEEIRNDEKIPEKLKESILAHLDVPDASDVISATDATYRGAVPGVRNCDLALVDPQTKAMLVLDGVGHNDETVVRFDHPFFKEMNDAMNEYIKGYDFSNLTDPEQFGRDFEKEFLPYWELQYMEGPSAERFAHHEKMSLKQNETLSMLLEGKEPSLEQMDAYMTSINTEQCRIALESEAGDYAEKKQSRENYLAAKNRLQKTDSSNVEEMRSAKNEVEQFGLQLLNLYGLDENEAKGLTAQGITIEEMVDDFDNAHRTLLNSIEALVQKDKIAFLTNDTNLLQLSQKYQRLGISSTLHNRTILSTRYSNIHRFAGRSGSSRGGPALGLAIPFKTVDGRQHVYSHNYADVSVLIIIPKEGEVIVDPDHLDPKQQVKIIQQDNQLTTTGLTGSGFGTSRNPGMIGKGITSSFPPGSAIFLITDGAGEFATENELTEAVARNLYGTPQEISDGLVEEVTRPEHQKRDFNDKEDVSRKRAAWDRQVVKKYDLTGRDTGGLDDLAFAGLRTINLNHFSSTLEEISPEEISFHSASTLASTSTASTIIPEAALKQETDQIHQTLEEYHSLQLNGANPIMYLKSTSRGSPPQLRILRQGLLEGLGYEEEKRIFESQTKEGTTTRRDRIESYNFNPLTVANWIIAQRQGEFSDSEKDHLRSLVEGLEKNEDILTRLTPKEHSPSDLDSN